MNWAGLWTTDPARACRPAGGRVATALRSATPALLFGLRLWAAVCLALYIAFWLQLDNAYWAGTSAAIVCQPSLGASLRKASFRMIGTVVGAVAIVVLTACFPQRRLVWGGTRWLHGGGHRQRSTRCDRGRKRRSFHVGRNPRQRDLHRNCMRGYCGGRDRFRPGTGPTRRPIRRPFRRGHRRIVRYARGADRGGDAIDAAGSD